MPEFLTVGPEDAAWTLLLAHGAGAGMETPFLARVTELLVERSVRVVRFEFGYMAARRTGGKRRPAPKAETLIPEYRAAVEAVHAGHFDGRLAIGGKSMGGRVASMIADELHEDGRIAGLLCLGYPFHPPAKPTQLRTAHLIGLKTPTLICQGTRDEFGTREEVAAYDLSDRIEVLWLEDGDHDLKPRKSVSGYSTADHLRTVAQAVAAWAKRITR